MEEFYHLTPPVVLKQFGVKPTGLPLGQTVVRLRKYGPNRLPKEALHPAWKIFLSQFHNVLMYILIAAAVISILLHETTDAVVILIAVVVNVVVGFLQENRAQKSLESLRAVLSQEATVIREGKVATIDAEQVVPGDVIRLTSGEKVPADARIIEGLDLEVDEASLTGESEPVKKTTAVIKKVVLLAERSNMIHSGTVITGGTGLAVVTATGMQTEIGKIATLMKSTTRDETPLQKRLGRLAHWIGIVVFVICAVVVGVGLLKRVPFVEIFGTAVAIAVGAIPEGLVISVTVILAIGMQRILKRKGLVRELLAAETLGSTDVICTDKTGTLTQGDMQVVSLHTTDHAWTIEELKRAKKLPRDAERILRAGMLCNDAIVVNPKEEIERWVVSGNLTDRSLLRAGFRLGLRVHELATQSPRCGIIPFNSERKLMATVHKSEGTYTVCVKGAPEIILAKSSHAIENGRATKLTEARKVRISELLVSLNKKGLRTLAIAERAHTRESITDRDLGQLTFLGVVGIADPLRSSAVETVRIAHDAGIRVVMVTGDHPLTAQRIATKLGLLARKENIIEGVELAKMSDEELAQRINHVNVFSRVSPEHKIRIVNAFQAKGHAVAMTGDGVNDAPALKRADIGVAVGSGTQVAKDAADLVLLNDDFSTIVAAIREGRIIFQNIKSVVLYLLSDSLSAVVLVISGLLLDLPLTITATQILWVNLTTDVFPALALTNEPGDPGVMQEPPGQMSAQVIDRRMQFFIGSVSLLLGLGSLFAFWQTLRVSGDVDLARTVSFMTLGVATVLYIFSVRSLRRSIIHSSPFKNQSVMIAVIIALVLQVASAYVSPLQALLSTLPLGGREWGLVLGVSVVVIVFIEVAKYVFRSLEQRAHVAHAVS